VRSWLYVPTLPSRCGAGWTAFVAGALIAATALAPQALAKTYTVNSASDPGNGVCNRAACTLREAIKAANARAGADTVRFKVGRGLKTLTPKSQLPAITEAMTLNGWTQPGFKRRPLIQLRGTAAGSGANGLVVRRAAESTVRGVVINRFDGNGMDVGGGPSGSGAAKIVGSYIGTDARGAGDRGNGADGVRVHELASVRIGGGTPKQRVVISGNAQNGVLLEQTDAGGAPSTIVGSRIGTNAKGRAALPNLGHGIAWIAPWGATIGGPNSGPSDNLGNLISGNGGAGIAFVGNCLPTCAAANVIQGNTVGTNVGVTGALPNADDGVLLLGAGNTLVGDQVGNTISGNGADGILMVGAASAVIEIQGNLVGLGPGLTDMGNSGNGILVAGGDARIGGTQAGESLNRIAFNGLAGVGVSGDAVTAISANSIHHNGGLGIDLGLDGPTANDPLDADTGPNFLQNRPELTSVISSELSTDITVELDSVAGTPTHPFRIELFSNPSGSCDPAGGEGDTYVGELALTTDETGHGSASLSLSPPLVPGTELSATATDTSDSFSWTSEFAACQSVPSS
jgi:trimeric autotransporter adhesin